MRTGEEIAIRSEAIIEVMEVLKDYMKNEIKKDIPLHDTMVITGVIEKLASGIVKLAYDGTDEKP